MMSDNVKASLLMVAAMTFFAAQDVFIKGLSDGLSPGQLVLLIAGGVPILLAVALAQGQPVLSRALVDRAVAMRNLCEFATAICLVSALAAVELSLVTAIMQAVPLLVTAGAAVWFAEPVGWRRWTAIGVGLAGVLIVLRPGVAGFDPAMLWAVGGAVAMAARDLATRAVPRSVASVQLSLWAFAVLVPAGLILMALEPGPHRWPDAAGWAGVAAMVVLGLIAYAALVVATRIGDIAAVAPFRYSRILVALVFGALVFGERPDALSLIGIALIVGSGLYTLVREARLRRRPVAAPSPQTPPGL
jgi:drug/metabolite transporter (DMT)-like permease